MTYTVEISKQADLDLRGIFEYIAFTLHSSVRHPYVFLTKSEDFVRNL
jgi:hypothetical protein